MISVKELFAENKYPQWISRNAAFSKVQYIRKIFSTIGISNFEEREVIDNTKDITFYASQVLDVIADSLSERIRKVRDFGVKAKIGKKRRENMSLLLTVMCSINDQLRKDKTSFIVPQETGKISLAIPEDIVNGNEIFMKKGAGLFKLYEKLNTMLKENSFLPLPDLSQKNQFKNFSAINIPSKEIIIKFSAEGAEGAWDIATMSMRGVNSCQTWNQGSGNSLKVIGSMIDPFTAIIYMTQNTAFNTYGSRMVRRCIVRYVIDRNSQEPFLLLEKMYPSFDQPSLDTFIKVLKARAPNINIKYAGQMDLVTLSSNSYIPLSDEVKTLTADCLPYCDSRLLFQEDKNCKFTKNTEALQKSFREKIPGLLQKSIMSRTFTKENVKKYGSTAAKVMANLRSKKLDKNKATKVAEVKLQTDADKIKELGAKFSEFVCSTTEDNPFQYILNKDNKCSEFFAKELNCLENKEFAEFVTSSVLTYINDHSK